jgi:hypothetical protein
MAALHEALQCLKPTSWDDVPQEPEELRKYVRDIFKSSRLIAESLPTPPPPGNDGYPGLDLDMDETSYARFAPSATRVEETDPEITAIQKEWGKPLKMGGPRDNPLDVTVWKLSASDGGGSWFGRRSVHEGLPFGRWRKKISTEYDETLKVNQKKIANGQTPDKSIRGIGAEEKVETIEIKDDDGSVLGELIVYHVSAQFPKPTAPRDFVAMVINSDSGLQIGGTKQPGRSWMMVSKPCTHPDVPPRQGFTRGEYESVELIREIPRKKDSSGSSSSSQKSKNNSGSLSSNVQRPHGAPERNGALADTEDDEINPVEWIMVTRSDPGGNIPRWMVDKGTPKSVGADAAKFINWAVQDDKPPKQEKSPSTESTKALAGAETKSEEPAEGSGSDEADNSDSDYESLESDGEHSHHGLIASVTSLLNSGLERYGPQALGYGPHTEASRHLGENQSAQMSADVTDHLSPESARQIKPPSEAESSKSPEPDLVSFTSAHSDLAAPAIDEIAHNSMPQEELIRMTKNSKLTSNEKELAKLALRKREVEAKLEELHAELNNLNISRPTTAPGTPLKVTSEVDSDTGGLRKRAATNRSSTPASTTTQQSQAQESSNDDQSSQTATPDPPAHAHKAASQLLSGESKLLKQLRKIEASQLKVASKIEAKQRKTDERSEKTKLKSKSEVENLKQEVQDLKKEVKQLRSDRQKWVDLVSSLQAENAKLLTRAES